MSLMFISHATQPSKCSFLGTSSQQILIDLISKMNGSLVKKIWVLSKPLIKVFREQTADLFHVQPFGCSLQLSENILFIFSWLSK